MEGFWRWSVDGDRHALGAFLAVRGIAVVLTIAFVSLAPQLRGLVGSNGILPLADRFPPLHGRDRLRIAHALPTLCWWLRSDRSVVTLAWVGAAASALAAIGIAPVPCLIVGYVAYLSLGRACDEFLSYQWDALILESTVVAVLLSPLDLTAFAPTPVPSPALWLGWLLLFRLMFGSGWVKLASGDPTWRSLDALGYHYETQPLPTPPAWYAHRLPRPLQRGATAAALGIELGVPFLIAGPRGLQAIAAAAFVGLMIVIQATGNFAFFNLNAIALSLLLLDDSALAFVPLPVARGTVLPELASALVVTPLALLAGCALAKQLAPGWRVPRRVGRALSVASRYGLVAAYGLFAVMTTERPEIVIEGSDDGRTWIELHPRWKPGEPATGPRFVAPHQPRLDWQLWFAALSPGVRPWVLALLLRVLEGSPAVMRFFAPGTRVPRMVRAQLYRYRFADAETRARTGAWWTRELLGEYVPAIALRAAVEA